MAASPDFFARLPSTLRESMRLRLRTQRAPRGRTILGAGSNSTDVHFILEGAVQVVLHAQSGREVWVRELGPGELFGDLGAVLGAPRAASVVAAADTRMAVMSQADFRACLDASPGACLWLAERLAEEVRRLTSRVFELSALNVQARLHCELLRLARTQAAGQLVVDPAPTHAELANRIGANREAVSREIGDLVRRNILRSDRRRIEFVDVDQLRLSVSRELGDLLGAEPPHDA